MTPNISQNITGITNAIGTVQTYIVVIATALFVLMISVAGLYIIVDRNAPVARRGELLAYIRTIFMGYGYVLGPNVLVAVVILALTHSSGHAVAGAPPVPPKPSPPPPHVQVVNLHCGVFGVDVCQGISDIINGFFNFLNNFVDIVVHVPPQFTYRLDGIIALWHLFYAISIPLLALIVMIGGFQMMIGRATGIDYTPPREFVPRIVFAALASFASLLICQQFINIGNTIADGEFAFTLAFVRKQAGVSGFLAFIGILITLGPEAAADPFVQFLFIVLVALFIILIIRDGMRLALLDVVIVVTPVIFLLWILPQTRRWAAFWLSLFVTTIVEVVLEDLCLCVALAILFSGDVQLGDAPFRIIIAISAIFLMLRIPGILARMGGVGGHRGFLSSPFFIIGALGAYSLTPLPFAAGVNTFLSNFGWNRAAAGNNVRANNQNPARQRGQWNAVPNQPPPAPPPTVVQHNPFTVRAGVYQGQSTPVLTPQPPTGPLNPGPNGGKLKP